MVELYEGLMTNRAFRRYTEDPVTDEEIELCIRAACQAPNGGNIQPYQFIVITDPEVKKAVRDVYQRAHARFSRYRTTTRPPAENAEEVIRFDKRQEAAVYLAEHLDQAPAIVLFLMPIIDWTPVDEEGPMDQGPLYGSVYPAVENFLLAARSIGIGTVLTTAIRIYHDEARAVLGIPDRFEIVALIPMGRPRGRFGVAPRSKPPEKLTHWNRFGNKRSFATAPYSPAPSDMAPPRR